MNTTTTTNDTEAAAAKRFDHIVRQLMQASKHA